MPHRNRVPSIHRVASHLARRFNQICVGVIQEATEPEGLMPIEYAVLVAVEERPGIDQRGVAKRLGIDPATTGKLVDRLERAGVIARRVDATDRRARALHITPRGVAIRQRVRPAMAVQHNKILAPLSPDERTTLIDLLTRVVEGNESYARPGHGRRAPSTRLAASAPTTERGKR